MTASWARRDQRLAVAEAAVARRLKPMASPELAAFLKGLSSDELMICKRLVELSMQNEQRQQRRAGREPVDEGLQ